MEKTWSSIRFPTANLAIKAERAMVPNGVYVVEAYVEGKNIKL